MHAFSTLASSLSGPEKQKGSAMVTLASIAAVINNKQHQ
jgi:hypothetical protein